MNPGLWEKIFHNLWLELMYMQLPLYVRVTFISWDIPVWLIYFLQAARLAGWLPQDPKQVPRVNHIGFGLVLGLDGKRFRTRASDVVRLVDLLDEAKARSKQGLIDRGLCPLSQCISSFLWVLPSTFVRITGREEDWDAEEMDLAAEALGYGAVKYESNLCFSFHVDICLCICEMDLILILISGILTWKIIGVRITLSVLIKCWMLG